MSKDNVTIVLISAEMVNDIDYAVHKMANNRKELWKQVRKYLKKITMVMFKKRPEKQSVRGVRWPKPSAKYKLSKFLDPKAISSRSMVYTGALKKSIRTLKRNNDGIMYGTNINQNGDYYAAHHDRGKSVKGGRFQFMFLEKIKDFKELSKLTINWLNM